MLLALALTLAAAPTPHVVLVKSSATASAAAVAKELKAQVGALEGCYDLALKAAPVKGTLTLTFELEPDSGVTTISASEDSLKDDTLVPCVIARLRTGQWPAAKKTLTVHATYRFELR
jgi:hypothetical protein